jgi:hypothetical protein
VPHLYSTSLAFLSKSRDFVSFVRTFWKGHHPTRI